MVNVLLSLLFISSYSWASYDDPNYAYPHKGSIEIDSDMLGKCMALETMNARPGIPAEFDFSKGSCGGKFDSDEFMGYLTANKDRPCDYKTGKESELKDWILKQKDNSIDPLSLYRQSVRLNGGDPWASVLTIHQVLRNEARWDDKKHYFYESTPEKERNFFNKMIDIRGDLAELGGKNTGDHEGTWYRMWGIMLYRWNQNGSSIRSIDTSKLSQCADIPRMSLVRSLGDLKSSAVAIGAEAVKLLGATSGEKDWRKIEINRKGASTASSFIKALTYNKETKSDMDLPQLCDSQKYLKKK